MNSENELSDFLDMIHYVYEDSYLKEIMDEYMENLWDKKNLFGFICKFCKKYLINNLEINNISYQFKMSAKSLLNDPISLLKYLKDCLKPKDLEKKKIW
jgi:hypothetical protein